MVNFFNISRMHFSASTTGFLRLHQHYVSVLNIQTLGIEKSYGAIFNIITEGNRKKLSALTKKIWRVLMEKKIPIFIFNWSISTMCLLRTKDN